MTLRSVLATFQRTGLSPLMCSVMSSWTLKVLMTELILKATLYSLHQFRTLYRLSMWLFLPWARPITWLVSSSKLSQDTARMSKYSPRNDIDFAVILIWICKNRFTSSHLINWLHLFSWFENITNILTKPYLLHDWDGTRVNGMSCCFHLVFKSFPTAYHISGTRFPWSCFRCWLYWRSVTEALVCSIAPVLPERHPSGARKVLLLKSWFSPFLMIIIVDR